MRPLTLSLTLLLGLLGTTARADEPVPGQPYAIPQGYEGYAPGSVINYGAYNYVIQDNATMLLADSQDSGGTDDATDDDDSVPVDTTAYQLPPGYEGAQPGSQISYGGNDYTVLSNGTMMMCDPGYSIADGTQYQVPPDYAGAGVGSIVNYGGSDYLIGAGVMIKIRVNANAGYGTTPLAGKPGSSLTGPRPPGSKPGVVNNVRPGTVGSNVHVTHRPNYTGAASPGWTHPGATQAAWINHAGARPGTVPPRGHGQTGLSPGWVNHGPAHPGAGRPGWSNAGAGRPGSVHPGWGNQPVVHSGGGRPMMGGGRPMMSGGRVGRR